MHSIQKSKSCGLYLSRYCKNSKTTQNYNCHRVTIPKPMAVFEGNKADMIESGNVLHLVTLISFTCRLVFFFVAYWPFMSRGTSKIKIFYCQEIARNTLH